MAGNAKIERQISLPMNQAMRIAMRNITLRLGRAAITGAGTMLGIAFLMSVFTTRLISDARNLPFDASQAQKSTWLVVMSLMVCVVGITNSMLMSVTERFKEIGTMKCLGALDSFIVRLFLIESGLLGFFGALIGAIIGGLFMLFTGMDVLGRLNWASFVAYIGACAIIGTVLSVVAAVPPAMRAAKMQAADAMRSEI